MTHLSPFLAPALRALWEETDKRWPKRDHASDGWLGDEHHSATSQHSPCVTCLPPNDGIVRALDIDDHGINSRTFLDAVIGDERVWYVIHDWTIWSRTYGWAPHRYTGTNGHTIHIHTSLRLDRPDLWHDTTRWLPRKIPPPVQTLPAVYLPNMREAFREMDGDVYPGVRRIQRALNSHPSLGPPLRVDGRVKRVDRKTYALWQRHLGFRGSDADGIPGMSSLPKLGRGRFRVTI